MPLTHAKIKNAKPQERDYKLGDGEGLYLLIKRTDKRSWRMKYRRPSDKKEDTYVIGPYPAISLAEAREARADAKRLLRNGEDPKRTLKTATQDNTLRNVATRYLNSQRNMRDDTRALHTLELG
jgi:hypothetical protein